MGMIRHLGLEDEISKGWICGYELATREPSSHFLENQRDLVQYIWPPFYAMASHLAGSQFEWTRMITSGIHGIIS